MNKRNILAAAALTALLGTGPALAGTTAGATEIIQHFDDTLLGVMQQTASLGYTGRYERLAPTIQQSFDVPFMTRIVVGPAWSSWTPEQQDTITAAFGRYLAATYARRFDGYDGESFAIDGAQDNGTRSLVSTHLNRVGDSPVVINYLMRPDAEGQPKIVDIFVTGSISELATRRSEFASILAQGGYPALLSALQANTTVSG